MASVNQVNLVGNLGGDVQVRYTQSGVAVANLTLATNERWTDKNGQKQERTEWHRVVVWGKLGEACGKYLSKGRQVHVSGSLQTRKWEDRDGNTRYTTEIRAREVTFLGSASANNSSVAEAQVQEDEQQQQELVVEDAPF